MSEIELMLTSNVVKLSENHSSYPEVEINSSFLHLELKSKIQELETFNYL